MSALHSTRALVALALAIGAVSWAAILIRLAAAPPLAIAFWRLALASLLLLPLLGSRTAASSRAKPVPAGHILLAGLLLALHFGFWIWSLALTTVASSVLLTSTQAVFSGLLGHRILSERTTARTWLAIGMTMGGIAIISLGDMTLSGKALLGDLLALGAACAGALYLLFGRRARQSGPLPVYLFKVNGVATLGLLVSCFQFGIPLSGFSSVTWLVFLLLAAGPHLAGHGLLNLAVRHLKATRVQLALMGEPLLATLYATLLLGESPSDWFYPGAALVLGGVLVEFLPSRTTVHDEAI